MIALLTKIYAVLAFRLVVLKVHTHAHARTHTHTHTCMSEQAVDDVLVEVEQEEESAVESGVHEDEDAEEQPRPKFDTSTKTKLARVLGGWLTSYCPKAKVLLATCLGHVPHVDTKEERIAKMIADANRVQLEAIGSGIPLGFFDCTPETTCDEIRMHVVSLHPDKYEHGNLIELYEGHSGNKFAWNAQGLEFTLFGCVAIGQKPRPKEIRTTIHRRRREFVKAASKKLKMRTLRRKSRSPKARKGRKLYGTKAGSRSPPRTRNKNRRRRRSRPR